ncbi:diphosphomevalonate/mevalonate 3,5-bisphosphate decarboxylase family protein [Legionella saoudiensis]|uniref:diphosphomevalonate decarboxylase n=1 Tax=Legionella saoudiensis TaxID=1750561 RepID=UPI00072FC885|nr:diphosphomevalonate decarboxylase [Legionella saoudiensis]
MHWLAHAPANIALIKYMGKKDESSNNPDNSSLSYTLNNLLSTVKLEQIDSEQDAWEPLVVPGQVKFALSELGEKKFLNHLARIKKYFNYEGSFLVQSCNNFPHSSGMASSASSFAALTRCAVFALAELTQRELPTVEEQASLSRLGSGSSCRSFHSPWVLWQNDNTVKPIELPYPELIHQVVVISAEQKAVSSSEAHKLVKSSELYETRAERAEENLTRLLNAFMAKDWGEAYQICWREFQDMHQLFNTCAQPFSYISSNSLGVLNDLQQLWDKKGDGPIVTMDAGPNIHLMYRPDQMEMAREFKRDYLVGNYEVL